MAFNVKIILSPTLSAECVVATQQLAMGIVSANLSKGRAAEITPTNATPTQRNSAAAQAYIDVQQMRLV